VNRTEIGERQIEYDREYGMPMSAQSKSSIRRIDCAEAPHALPSLEKEKATSEDVCPQSPPPIAVSLDYQSPNSVIARYRQRWPSRRRHTRPRTN